MTFVPMLKLLVVSNQHILKGGELFIAVDKSVLKSDKIFIPYNTVKVLIFAIFTTDI